MDDYQPVVRGAEDPTVAVALTVEDSRRFPDPRDLTYVGVINGLFGKRTEYRVSDPVAVRYLVRAATMDALRLAGIWVLPDAPRTLVVTIQKFWVAVPSRETHVVVELALHDRDGAALWTASAAGGAGGWLLTEFAQPMMRGVYQRSLADYAETASEVFASRDFQRQLY